VSDVADLANDVMQERLDRLLAQRQKLSIEPSALECIECDSEIPEARRIAVAGTQHCIECASILERKRFINGGK
jgi:phage/conjugal plasmid C-4 type zinc finger TraR family protein